MDPLFRLPFQYDLQKRHDSQSAPYLLTPSITLARMYYDLDVLSRPPFKHTTLSLHIGGSSVYGDRTRLSRDFDGIMILPTFRDILRIVSCPRALSSLLMVTPEPGTEKIALIAERCLVAPELITHHPFEVVRFSGTSTDGQKKSIKILSFQFLQMMALCVDKPCVVPVLSLKDRRNFHASVRYPFGLQPVTSDASDSVHILHDADILLRRNRGPAASQRDAIAFGCTMDLLLTSHMVHLQVHQRWAAIWRLSICRSDVSPLNLRLWHHAIFQKFLHACDCSSSSHHISVFGRSASFSIEFCRNLAEKLGVEWPTDKISLSTGDDDPAFYLSLL
ncbi:hypothetical protein A0H81_02164 [Grifola frondosa]|uniref:Uncharacterized protein n=1 Tax=Grifola frondosa TaxID=5627 RepID=A0A1C7MNG3_GRIFR|nr:hypothetical protein A0H81_02164 [Grifola frondosa]